MNIYQRFVLGLTFCLAAPCFAGPLVDSQLGQMLNLKEAHKISFIDMNGNPVTEEQFIALPGSFNIEKQKNADGTVDVVLRKKVPNEKPKLAAVPVALKVGDTLPKFALKRLDGQVIDSKSLSGRYSVLSFYFAECGPCIQEVPQLNALAKAHPDMGILALTFDSIGDAKAFVQKRKLELPVLAEADVYIKTLKVQSYPLLVVVGPDAKVVAVRSGLNDHALPILAWVDGVLGKTK